MATTNQMAEPQQTTRRLTGGKTLLRGLVIIAALVGLGLLANQIDFEQSFEHFGFTANHDAPWYRGPAGFVLAAALAVCLSCPRQLVAFVGAYTFGLWAGFAAALAGTVIACIVSYSIAALFKQYFARLVRGRLDIAVRFWRDNTFLATLIWRFLPVGSNLLTNLAAGAFAIPAIRFVAGSAIGYVPQALVFAFVGSGVKVESGLQVAVSVALFVLSGLLGMMLYRRYRRQIRSSG